MNFESRLQRWVAFLIGAGIMVFETIGDHHDRPWLIAGALGMMGLPFSRGLEELLARLSSSSSPDKDEEPRR